MGSGNFKPRWLTIKVKKLCLVETSNTQWLLGILMSPPKEVNFLCIQKSTSSPEACKDIDGFVV